MADERKAKRLIEYDIDHVGRSRQIRTHDCLLADPTAPAPLTRCFPLARERDFPLGSGT
jgi:hypothetical protein